MKSKVIITLLLFVSTICVTIGQSFLPLWCVIPILCISLFILVSYLTNCYERSNAEKAKVQLDNIEALRKAFTNMQIQIDCKTVDLLKSMTNNQELILKQIAGFNSTLHQTISEKFDVLHRLNEEHSKQLTSILEIQKQNLDTIVGLVSKQSIELANKLNSLAETYSINSEKIASSINQEREDSKCIIKDASTLILENLINNATSLKETINIGFGSLESTSKEQTSRCISEIGSSSERLFKSFEEYQLLIKEQVTSSEDSISLKLIENVLEINKTMERSLIEIKQLFDSSSNIILNVSKEQSAITNQKIDEISLASTTIQETIGTAMEAIASYSDQVNQNIDQSQKKIQDNVGVSERALAFAISKGNTEVITKLSESINNSRSAVDSAAELIMQYSKEQQEELKHQIESLDQHVETNHTVIFNDIRNILSESQSSLMTITESNNRLKEHIIETTDKSQAKICTKIAESVNQFTKIVETVTKSIIVSSIGDERKTAETITTIQPMINSLVRQSNDIYNLIKNSIDATDESSEEFLTKIQEECINIGRQLTSIEFTTHNVEETVTVLLAKDSHEILIESIKNAISSIKNDVISTVSELSDQALETQILQESANSELANLKALLRTLIASYENGSRKTEQRRLENNKENNGNTKVNSENDRKDSFAPGLIEQKPNPNRIDTIVDEVTKNTVTNIYENGILVKSSMKDKAGHVKSETEYKNSKLVKSRSFDEKGKVSIEYCYYDNGQVHYRNEYRKNGKVTTEYDINGNEL